MGAAGSRIETKEYKIVQVRFLGGGRSYYYLAPSTWNIQEGDRAYRSSMMDRWGTVYRIGLHPGDELPRYSLKVLDRYEHPEPPPVDAQVLTSHSDKEVVVKVPKGYSVRLQD